MKYAAAYGIALVLFLILDALWLGVIARNLYATRIGEILLEQPRWGIAALFYAIYLVGLVYFGVTTGFTSGSVMTAALNGALFGFFAYATYDLTSLAVLKGFDELVTVLDIVWGTFLGGVVAGGTVFIMQKFGLA